MQLEFQMGQRPGNDDTPGSLSFHCIPSSRVKVREVPLRFPPVSLLYSTAQTCTVLYYLSLKNTSAELPLYVMLLPASENCYKRRNRTTEPVLEGKLSLEANQFRRNLSGLDPFHLLDGNEYSVAEYFQIHWR
jgi:hypothetical protein